MSGNSSQRRRLAVVLLLVFPSLIACVASKQPEPTAATYSANPAKPLSIQDRIEIFEEVWRTINDEYYDSSFNGVDWQEVRDRYRPPAEAATSDMEFYRLFEVMLAELRDAHTVFNYPPSDSDQRVQPTGSVGITLGEIEGATVIAAVEQDSDAKRAGVRPGMILRTVNGRLVEELFAEIRTRFAGSSTDRSMKNVMHRALLYGGFLGASRTFGVEGFDGAVFDVVITHHGAPSVSPVLTARRLPSGYGYIKFNQWKPPMDERLKSELAKLTNAPGLIIDLRGNGGGQTDVLLNISSLFFPTKTSFGGFKKRGGTLDAIITHKPEMVYTGAVVILVDDVSASASEVFTVSMQEHNRALVVGQQTCGCVLNQWSKKIRGGGTLRWSARVYSSPNSRVLEGTGVIPDERFRPTISDLRYGRDRALASAENRLRARLGSS